jgi:hypothetical protein
MHDDESSKQKKLQVEYEAIIKKRYEQSRTGDKAILNKFDVLKRDIHITYDLINDEAVISQVLAAKEPEAAQNSYFLALHDALEEREISQEEMDVLWDKHGIDVFAVQA